MMKIKNLSVKKVVILVLMVFILAVSSSAAKQTPLITADILKYEPSPVEPGDIMEVYVSVTNDGTTSEAFTIEFIPEFPFSLGSGEEELKTLAALPRGENAIIKFWINVNANSPSEDRNIKFNYRYTSNPTWAQLKSPIAVRTSGAILHIAEYTTMPTTAKPGGLVDIELTLRNSGSLDVRNVDITLNLDESKFSTIGSGTSKRVSLINAGDTEKVKFTLIADTSTEIKVHSIPVTLNFKDSRGTRYTEDTSFSLIMGAEPELMAVVDSTTISSRGRVGTVTLKVINRGIMDLKYLNMKLVSTDQYDVLSASNEAYIGNLDSDDFETVDFIIKPKKTDVQLKAIVDFKDPYNREYQRQFLLPLRVFSAKELGTGGSSLKFFLVLLVLAAVIGYWYYRRRKKKK